MSQSLHDRKLKELEKIWYKRLKEEGFHDAEVTSHGERFLKHWDNEIFRNNFDVIKYGTTLEYYTIAKKMLETYKFKNEKHRRVWQLHCEGLSERKIAKLQPYRKSMVHYVISLIAYVIKKED